MRVGKVVYLDGSSTPTTIIGVVERLQVPGTGSWTNSFTWNATLVPTRLNGNFARYAIRTKPGRLDAAMRAAPDVLYSGQSDARARTTTASSRSPRSARRPIAPTSAWRS